MMDSVLLLTKFTHDAWAQSKDKYVSIIFLDIKATFPSMVVETLIYNMRKRGIPREYTNWYQRRLEMCKAIPSFNDFQSEPFNIPIGLDQGCPLSPITFLFYNTDLIGLGGDCHNILTLRFINNTAFVARGKSVEVANKKLLELMNHPGGALEWSASHQAEFEIDKTSLIHATHNKSADPLFPGCLTPTKRPSITINGHHIKATTSCKFLGVFIDQELHFAT